MQPPIRSTRILSLGRNTRAVESAWAASCVYILLVRSLNLDSVPGRLPLMFVSWIGASRRVELEFYPCVGPPFCCCCFLPYIYTMDAPTAGGGAVPRSPIKKPAPSPSHRLRSSSTSDCAANTRGNSTASVTFLHPGIISARRERSTPGYPSMRLSKGSVMYAAMPEKSSLCSGALCA